MISLRARLVRFVTRQLFRTIDGDADIPELRARWEKLAARSRMAPDVRVKYVDIAGLECEWLVPSGCKDAPVLYYLHGGAYVSGSAKTHRSMVGYLAKKAGMRALLPNYRLAPEYPFPAGLDDCIAVYRALCEQGVSPSRIAVGGDSAGGGMTMAALMKLRDEGDALPRAAVLLSPWLDLKGTGQSTKSRARQDPMFKVEDMPNAARHYAPAEQQDDPLVSPVYGDVRGLPPVLIQVGDHEILLSDSTRIAEKISAAGGQVTLQVWPHMWHVFQYFIGRMPEAQKGLLEVAAYLRSVFPVADVDTGTDKAA